MSDNAQAIKEIVELTKAGIPVETKVIGDMVYTHQNLKEVECHKEIETQDVTTLTGIVDFVNNNIDELNKDELFLHIDDPKTVYLKSKLNSSTKSREIILRAEVDEEFKLFEFGKWHSQENFIIMLRSLFINTNELADLLKFVSKVTASSSMEVADDGVMQNVTVKKGISGAMVTNVVSKPIVTLQPYRTFSEVEQPESEFLFRVHGGKDGAEFGLFEADGGRWNLAAVKNIKDYLVKADLGVKVIA